MQQPSQDIIIAAIQSGIRKAEKSYQLASGVPLWDGPEYLMTVFIYQSILRLMKRDCLTLELKPETIADYAPKRKNRPYKKPISDARLNGHSDITLWIRDQNITRALIEVKGYASDCVDDVGRIIDLLNKNLEFGVLASLLFMEFEISDEKFAKIKILDNLDNIFEKLDQKVKSYGKFEIEKIPGKIKIRILDDEPGKKKNWLWFPVCFIIRPTTTS